MTRAPIDPDKLRKTPVRKAAAGSGGRKGSATIQGEIDGIIRRLDFEIPQARKSMDELLTRLRSPRR